MIERLCGEVIEVKSGGIVVAVAGVGLGVQVPVPLLTEVHVGHQIQLWTVLRVRDDGFSLFGFSNEEQRTYFEKLLQVSGIGPRLALNVLSICPTADVQVAVSQGKPDFFQAVPGVGRRTAEKIIVELKGKLPEGPGQSPTASALQVRDMDLASALANLGYKQQEVSSALKQLRSEDSFSQAMRQCLALLSKGTGPSSTKSSVEELQGVF